MSLTNHASNGVNNSINVVADDHSVNEVPDAKIENGHGSNGTVPQNLEKQKWAEKVYAFPDVVNDVSDQNIDDTVKKKDEGPDKKEEAVPGVSFFALFKYSTCLDKILICIGVLSSLASGASMPLIIIFLGNMLESFVGFETTQGDQICNGTTNESIISTTPTYGTTETTTFMDTTTIDPNIFINKLLEECAQFAGNMSLVGAACFVLNYITVFTLSWSAENQALRIRQRFLQAVLRQDIGWYDTNETGDFASRITADLQKIQDGIGDKVGICIYFFSTTIISIVIAFVYGWKLTLVILSAMPVMIISTSIIAMIQSKVAGDELSAYGKAGAIAEEVLSSIRTVVSFGGEKKEIDRYEKELFAAKKNGIKRGMLTSIGMATFWFCIYASYSLAFWYGTKLVLDTRCTTNEYSSGKMIVIFFNVLTGAMFVGQTAPYMEAFATARGAARKVFDIIARVPPIDSSSDMGERPRGLSGMIKITDAFFRYPSRPDVPILRGFNVEAVPGETVALVGSSGCGKSTVIQLLQRFYDLDQGQVLIDGKDIRLLNLGWLRDKIGVVGQEPVLFNTSIEENIRYGMKEATDEQIIQAAKEANAHDFITKLPMGYNTEVGQRGTQLSGGQKQRIAIARALIRNPKILLLDEATSALDNESESIVQAALDEARKGRTTIVVAHRLSTIRNANKIVAVDKGAVIEEGTHDELMEKKGVYYNLVLAQAVQQEKNEDEGLEEIEEDDEGVEEGGVEIVKRPHSASTISEVGSPQRRPVSKIIERQMSVASNKSYESGEGRRPTWRRQSSVLKNPEDHKKLMEYAATADEEELDPEEKKGLGTCQLLRLTAPEWPYTTMGCLGSFLIGFSIPIYGILLGDILKSMNKPDAVAIEETNFYCIIFLIMGVASGLVVFMQTFSFTVAGECLTLRLRKMVFTTMVRQEMGWYDLPSNSTGALCSRLSADAAQVQGATGSKMSTMIQSLATLAAAIAVAVYFNWKIGLVVLAFVPVVLLSVYFESRVIAGNLLDEKAAFEKATKVAVEAIGNIRTVASLHLEQTFFDAYALALAEPHKMARKKAYLRGLTFGLSQCIPCLTYGASMYYGSTLIAKGELDYGDLFKVVEGIITGSMIIGQAVAFAPDAQKAKVSAVRIFRLLEKVSEIDPFSGKGVKPVESRGEVDFKDVAFTYPTRPTVKVLRGLGLECRQGETIALVGSSGCGKSTCIQLLQRFYDPDRGDVKLDRDTIQSLELGWLRSQMGIVSQEPVLFGYSIKENIAYGDNTRQVPMEEIIEAARKANIHNFVSSLPAQYDTNVGDRGTQLSGGQKQRIAIARALVRNPRILLLDEATSALDSESEQVVQEALDKASEGRTCIVIAHRLSTIQNADQILVIHKGKVVEKGTHRELMASQGFYHKLHMVQGTKNESDSAAVTNSQTS